MQLTYDLYLLPIYAESNHTQCSIAQKVNFDDERGSLALCASVRRRRRECFQVKWKVSDLVSVWFYLFVCVYARWAHFCLTVSCRGFFGV